MPAHGTVGLFEGIKTGEENTSKRFESGFHVRSYNNSIMLSELEVKFGIWVAHGEGRFNPDALVCRLQLYAIC